MSSTKQRFRKRKLRMTLWRSRLELNHPYMLPGSRKLRLKPIPASWDPKWTPSRTPLFDPRSCLNQYFTDFFKIECPVEGWSYNIEELIEQIASL
ncbi:unnamed protein product, partial [Mesorhabditis belari]|uniref:Uncharacterized protein n=1 Tax=Mesorhabditis belari TaxID=2138241 RepID=A0AAF3EP54_9BILA